MKHDALTQALIDAGDELSTKHLWSIRDNAQVGPPEPDDTFVQILLKHLRPLVPVQTPTARKLPWRHSSEEPTQGLTAVLAVKMDDLEAEQFGLDTSEGEHFALLDGLYCWHPEKREWRLEKGQRPVSTEKEFWWVDEQVVAATVLASAAEAS